MGVAGPSGPRIAGEAPSRKVIPGKPGIGRTWSLRFGSRKFPEAEDIFEVLRQVLIISRNDDMTRWMQWSLEDLGFAVELSSSLEQSFLGSRSAPFMVVVDADAIGEDEGHAKQYLAWFHRRSPILLVANSGSSDQLREECDLCLPRAIGREKFLAGIRKLGRL